MFSQAISFFASWSAFRPPLKTVIITKIGYKHTFLSAFSQNRRIQKPRKASKTTFSNYKKAKNTKNSCFSINPSFIQLFEFIAYNEEILKIFYNLQELISG